MPEMEIVYVQELLCWHSSTLAYTLLARERHSPGRMPLLLFIFFLIVRNFYICKFFILEIETLFVHSSNSLKDSRCVRENIFPIKTHEGTWDSEKMCTEVLTLSSRQCNSDLYSHSLPFIKPLSCLSKTVWCMNFWHEQPTWTVCHISKSGQHKILDGRRKRHKVRWVWKGVRGLQYDQNILYAILRKLIRRRKIRQKV